jgi:hypothetical protein
MTVAQVAEATGASTRGLAGIMNVLVSLNFLAKGGEAMYSLTPESSAFLVSTKPAFQGGLRSKRSANGSPRPASSIRATLPRPAPLRSSWPLNPEIGRAQPGQFSANSTSCRQSCTLVPACNRRIGASARYKSVARERSSRGRNRSTCSPESPSSGPFPPSLE